MSPHRLLTGTVMHHRHRPVTHRFAYPMFAVELDVDDLASTPRALAIDRPGWLAFRSADHGPRDGTSLATWIRDLLVSQGLSGADGRVTLLAMPRLFGYLFNPVSFWFCHDRHGALRAVLAEVNNTFGEHHNYLVHRPDRGPIGDGDVLTARKVFHVSPFLDVEGEYRFRFVRRDGRLQVAIGHDVGGARVLSTALWGATAPLHGPALRRAALRTPLQTFAVMARIHWHALRLWLKGVAFHGKPLPPLEETSS
ncbi:MAG: DUF1365 domain-containing protein [Gammaproteobacteria bacterium]|nr:DUF1365 domain-containing protein [Gammaproteobacteria bacterium]